MSNFKLKTSKLLGAGILFLVVSAFFACLGLTIKTDRVRAQQVNNCQPPIFGEYLVLIVTPTLESQEIVRQTLPGDINIRVCRYRNDIVTRIGGFSDREIADDWRRYIRDNIQLPAYLVEGGTNPNPNPNLPEGFPRNLGPGYAVIVDYAERPEVAVELQRILARDIGLVSYGEKSFLLITYTENINDAAQSLKRLSDRGFLTYLVNSNRLIIITDKVRLTISN